VIFLSDSSRIKVMVNYLKQIRGIEINLVPDTTLHLNDFQSKENIEQKGKPYVYHLLRK